MKGFAPEFNLETPRTLSEALDKLSTGQYRAFAGGTDLMVLFEAGKLPAGSFLDITRLDEMKGIKVADGVVEIGGLTTYSEILSNSTLKDEFPLLCEAARLTGAVAIQNRGTLGGNIANGSPAADSPPALLVYDTEIELVSKEGSRRVGYEGFHKAYKKMDLAPGELISKIIVKRNTQNWQQYYRKVGTRKAQAISKVCIAAAGVKKGKQFEFVRISLGSVAPIPLRLKKVEALVTGQSASDVLFENARQVAISEISPIDDIRSTKEYRLEVAANLVADFLRSL